MYEEILSDSPVVDAVCYGEGEKPLLDLIKSSDKRNYLRESESWITHEKLFEGKKSYSHDFIWDLDEIPFLDYDMLDLPGYTLNPTSSRYEVSDTYKFVDEEQEHMEQAVGRNTLTKPDVTVSMPVMTSRGCPFKCTFCASHAAHGRSMRYHSLDRVREDLEKMRQKYSLGGVVIQDDHFMGGKRRPYDIVNLIGNLDLEMFFQNALAIYALDLEFLRLLKDMGVNELTPLSRPDEGATRCASP